MKKEFFKVGDKVYHIQYGWGVISELSINDILVDFQNKISAWVSSDGNLLSFTEYTLQGFSQERPIVLPEVGEDVLVYDENSYDWILRQFERYVKCSSIPFHVTDRDCFLSYPRGYSKLKRIKILD